MTHFTLKLTAQELALLAHLASDQLFRKEFIDPKFPGYKPNAAELSLGKKLVERIRLMADRARGAPLPAGMRHPTESGPWKGAPAIAQPRP